MLHEAAYLPALVVATALAFLTAWRTADEKIARVMAVVLANWLAGIVFNIITGIHDGWQFNILIDSSASALILWRPAGKIQALLGISYCVQIAMHGGYGAAKLLGSADPNKYYAALTAVAWVQLLVIGGWCVALWAVHRRGGSRSSANLAPSFGSMAQP